jgi:hypothetical protein
MAKGIHDLGGGLGYIYIVKPDGTTIRDAMLNTQNNAKRARLLALEGSAVALNRKPNGTITVDTVTGVGNITAITINGIGQIDVASPIAFTGATSTDALAALIRDGINSFDDPAAPGYTATVSGSVVTVIGSEDIGSDDNGQSIIVTISANATSTQTAINNGSDASELWDEVYGNRIFLNADYDADGCAGATAAVADSITQAVEISDEIIPRSLTSALDVQSTTISGGVVTINRESAITMVNVDTQASAGTDTLDTIGAAGFADGDIIIFRGTNAGRITTFSDGTGNLSLEANNNFLTAGQERSITLQLIGSTWLEVARTSQAVGAMADYRTAGFGSFGVDTKNTAATATSGTVTFNGGTDSRVQELTGTVTLVGNSTYALGTGVNGDEFWLSYDSAVTLGGNNLVIFGITLSSTQALNGGLLFHARYVSGAWESYVMPSLDAGLTNTFVASSEFYGAASVDAAALATGPKTDLVTLDVSFETGEQGGMKLEWPYACTIDKITGYVKKAVAGTDNGTMEPLDSFGGSMGIMTATAAAGIGTGFTLSPSVNNVIAAGDIITFVTNKTTPGGKLVLSIKCTKT